MAHKYNVQCHDRRHTITWEYRNNNRILIGYIIPQLRIAISLLPVRTHNYKTGHRWMVSHSEKKLHKQGISATVAKAKHASYEAMAELYNS